MNDSTLDNAIRTACANTRPSANFQDRLEAALHAIAADGKSTHGEAENTVANSASAQTETSASPVSDTREKTRARRIAARWLPRIAAAAVIALGIGGTAFAADKLGLSLWQTDARQVQIAPASGEADQPAGTDATQGAASEQTAIDEYRLLFDYVPESLTDRTGDIACGYFQAEGYEGWSQYAPSIDYYPYYLDTDETAIFSSIDESRLINIGGHEAALLEFDFGMYASERQTQTRLYIAFPAEKRIVRLQTSDESLRGELMEVARGLSLEPTGNTTPLYLQDLWSHEAAVETETAEETRTAEEPFSTLPRDPLTDEAMGALLSPDEPFALAENPAVEVSIGKISLSDDASHVDRERMPFGWRAFIGDDGTIKPDTISFVKLGDGKSTADAIVEQKTSPLKLLEIDVTFANTSDETISDIGGGFGLERVVHRNGTWSAYRRVDECPQADEAQNSEHINERWCWCVEVVDGDASLTGGDLDRIASLGPGETATLRYQWLINADEADKLLLDVDFDGYGAFAEGTYGQRFVDIRQTHK